MSLLEIENLSMHFGSLIALEDVNISVEHGEILGLIGPNGAGKTTFFNCITGYLSPTKGSIRFGGHELSGLRPNKICKYGICRTFQIVQNFQDMTALENVMLGAFCRFSGISKAAVYAQDILEFSGLMDKSSQIAGSLTIADQKRLELAKALATQPQLLFLDEVMAGLNAEETQEAIELVRKVHQRGVTIIVVEHVMEVIMNISQRIIVLDHGRMIAVGHPREIVQNPQVIEAYLGEEYNARS
ncbi:MAG: ABC transporter ATP-binding protein [Deltaproteobacteria bacterium]|nr:ABC transporter ATP-binding protein [Deltaproteobacteria bacterium]